jgi:molybdenum cofactor biosynthesis protein B
MTWKKSARGSKRGSPIPQSTSSSPPAALLVSQAKIGTSAIQTRATAGVAGGTYIFCLPGSPGACRDAWDEILLHQLDYRYRPCNFVEIMPRLDEHLRRAKAKGATA